MGSLFGAILGGAGSLLGGFLNQGAASNYGSAVHQAAGIAAKGAKKAGNEAAGGYTQASSMLQPYATQGAAANTQFGNAIGANGLPAQQSFYNNFQNDPGYQATLQQGIGAAEQGGAGTGAFNSGGTLKALMAFGQRQLQDQFQTRLNYLQGLGNQGYNAAGQQGQDVIGAGNARAGGILGAANAKSGGILGQAQANMYGQGAMNQGITGALGSAAGYFKPVTNDLSSFFKQFQPQTPQVSGYMPNQYGGNLGMGGY